MLQQSLALFQWLSGSKPKRMERSIWGNSSFKIWGEWRCARFFEPQQTGHGPLFPHPRIGTRTFIRSLEQIRGIRKGYCLDNIWTLVSFEKACSSAVVVHARTSILASRVPAHFSARWGEWILLTAREQEGVFFWRRTIMVPGLLDLRPAISFYLGSPFLLEMFSWSVAVLRQQVPSLMASTHASRALYYRSGNISDLANLESHWVTSHWRTSDRFNPSNFWPETRRQKIQEEMCLKGVPMYSRAIEFVWSKAFDLSSWSHTSWLQKPP